MAALAAWLYANVLGNIVASALWAWPALTWHHIHVRRRLKRLNSHIDDLHAKVDQQMQPPEGGTP